MCSHLPPPSLITMDRLYRRELNLLILEIYGFIIPTEGVMANKLREKRKRSLPEYTVEQLRAQWIEAMIEQGVGRSERASHPGKTNAEIAHEKAHRPRAPGKYYPVSRAEVEAARDTALKEGVTLSSYRKWIMLRRNYEADPTVLQKGPWRQVQRGPLPTSRMPLMVASRQPGTTLRTLAAEIEAAGERRTERQEALMRQINMILDDMKRPLRPRRTKLQPGRKKKSMPDDAT